MLNWTEVGDSTMITAIAYDEGGETIYVRFKDGAEWWYAGCPPQVWEEFTRPGQSKGRYFHTVLKHKPQGEHSG